MIDKRYAFLRRAAAVVGIGLSLLGVGLSHFGAAAEWSALAWSHSALAFSVAFLAATRLHARMVDRLLDLCRQSRPAAGSLPWMSWMPSRPIPPEAILNAIEGK